MCCPTSKKLMTAIIITQEVILSVSKLDTEELIKKSICVKGSKVGNALSLDIVITKFG